MRAFAVRSFGEAPAIHDLPIPAVDGAFLIRVRYAGVNPIDYKLLERLTATSTYPFVVCRTSPVWSNEFRKGNANSAPATASSARHEHTARTPRYRASTEREDRTAGAYPRLLTNRQPRYPSRQ
jgi:hypothetical protein